MSVSTQYRRYRAIADKITGRIKAGEYAVGARLPSERELADEFGVSRPTLREALIALEIMGFVAVRGGSGVYVAEPGEQHSDRDPGFGTFELLEARKIIEADVAAIAARTITSDQLVEIRQQLELQMKDLEEKGRFSYEEDMRFHTLIAEGTGNGALYYVVEQLWHFRRESDIWRVIDERTDMKALQVRAIEDHVRIFNALEARDGEAAYDAMRSHMQHNIDWRLSDILDIPAVSDKDRRSKLRLLQDRDDIAGTR